MRRTIALCALSITLYPTDDILALYLYSRICLHIQAQCECCALRSKSSVNYAVMHVKAE